MEYLVLTKSKTCYKNEIGQLYLKLIVQFCKQHKIMGTLYTKKKPRWINDNVFKLSSPQTFVHLMSFLLRGIEKDFLKAMQISQLWRFFILDSILNKQEYTPLRFLKADLINKIEKNGYRNSKEIKKLFEKYNLKTKIQ